MPLSIREMGPDDARAFLEVHHVAVRELATADYPTDVISAWAPLPVTDKDVELVRLNADRECRLVAEFDGKIVGVACLVPANSELRACRAVSDSQGRRIGNPSRDRASRTRSRRDNASGGLVADGGAVLSLQRLRGLRARRARSEHRRADGVRESAQRSRAARLVRRHAGRSERDPRRRQVQRGETIGRLRRVRIRATP
jgi:hypothetical protein